MERMRVGFMLKQLGISNVEFAVDGSDALKVLTSFSPNLILTDIHMRQMDGIEFVKILRSNSRKTISVLPVIFMSGDKTRSTIESVMQLGSAGYVLKPLQIILLREKLKHALEASAPAEGA